MCVRVCVVLCVHVCSCVSACVCVVYSEVGAWCVGMCVNE